MQSSKAQSKAKSRSAIRVSVAPGSGFCFGVKRAIRLAERALEESKGPFYTLGELIHNPQVVGELEKRGLRIAKAISEIEKGTLIIRSHGVSDSITEEARRKGLEVVDATCPFVKKAQELAALLSNSGYSVVVVGDRGHPEVDAIAAGLRDVVVVGTETEVESLKKVRKLGVVAQTTQSLKTLSGVVGVLLGKTQELRVYNTICETTFRRQAETLKLAGVVDVMVVVGGKNSANTSRLYDICRRKVGRTHWVESASELRSSWFKGAVHAGVAGGASTPDWLIQQVADRIVSVEAPSTRASTRASFAQKRTKKKGESV